MRIVLCYPVEPRHVAQIASAAPDAEVVDAGQERVDELLPTADIFIGHAKVPVDWARVLQAGRLQWIQSSAAGLDHCLVPGVIESEILVSSASGLFAPQVAEQTMALMFGLVRRAAHAMERQQNRLLEAESLATMGEMASSVAHGLRNPLASIRSSAELAIDSDDNQEIRELLGDDLEKGLEDNELRSRLFSANMRLANPEANRLRHQLRDLYYFNEAWIPELKKSGIGRVQLRRQLPLDKDGRTIRGADCELGLKEPRFVFSDPGFLLRVDQEQGQRPGAISQAAQAAYVHIVVVWVGKPGVDRTCIKRHRL